MDSYDIEQCINKLNSKSLEVRNQSKETLLAIGLSSVPALLRAIEQGNLEVYFGLEMAVEILGELGDLRVVEPLINILGTADVYIRLAAVIALGKLGDARAVQPLIAAFRSKITDEETDIELWVEAAKALGKIGTTALEPLVAALTDENAVVRAGVADALGHLGDSRAVNDLIHLLEDTDEQVKLEAIKALGDLNDNRALPHLIENLWNSDRMVRVYTLRALGKLGDLDALAHVARYVSDPDRDIRRSAIYALRDLLAPRSLELLQNELQSTYSKREAQVEQILVSLKAIAIKVPQPNEISQHLIDHLAIIPNLLQICEMSHSHFLGRAQLSLELYVDPEIDDKHLTLYVRQQKYESTLIDEIDKILESSHNIVIGDSARILVTTDFHPLE